MAVYESRPTKRRRRTRAEIEALKDALYAIVAEQHPMTVRQVFYQAVSRGLVPKTEAAYKNDVGRLLVLLRREGRLPYTWLTDSTRWMRKPTTFGSVGEALRRTAQFYRRSVWAESPVYVEVWIEKDALAGVVHEVTEAYDVPLMVGRGYASLSYLHAAAEQIRTQGKPAFIYFFGDHDPSGLDAIRFARQTLREFAGEAEIHFEHMAVTWPQIEAWNLPTRPTKRTDTRSKAYGDKPSVELDAIPPDVLRSLVKKCIERHIDPQVLKRLAWIEAEERQMLETIAKVIGEQGSVA